MGVWVTARWPNWLWLCNFEFSASKLFSRTLNLKLFDNTNWWLMFETGHGHTATKKTYDLNPFSLDLVFLKYTVKLWQFHVSYCLKTFFFVVGVIYSNWLIIPFCKGYGKQYFVKYGLSCQLCENTLRIHGENFEQI